MTPAAHDDQHAFGPISRDGRQRLGELRQDPLCRRLRDRNGVGHNGQVRTFWSERRLASPGSAWRRGIKHDSGAASSSERRRRSLTVLIPIDLLY